ncbi:MAG: HemK2/MTQ2 family protein methyltransferase [Nanobdellota archaeon]
MVYEPSEDSNLLKRNIKKHAEGVVLDMGTGSGILAQEASKYSQKVYAADIDLEVIDYCKKNLKGIQIIQSDLFKSFFEKNVLFDTIIFNPPYLPQDVGIKDYALYGGKNGYETIARFFDEAVHFMKDNTKILLLFSSFTKKEKVDEIIHKKCLKYKEIDNEKLFFEKLYVYLVEKSDLLLKLENEKIKNIEYFAKGKRGIIYTGNYQGKDVAIKAKNPDTKAIGKTKQEADMLIKVNKMNIGPRFLFSGYDYLVYEFVKGVMLLEYLKNNDKDNIKKVLTDILGQLKTLDDSGINKEEMNKPKKHIIVGKYPVMIDFERSKHSIKPQNITQFIIYLCSTEIKEVLRDKGFTYSKDKLIRLAKDYKENYPKTDNIFEKIKNEFQ